MIAYKNGKGKDFRIHPANCAISNQYKSWHLNEDILAIAQDAPLKQMSVFGVENAAFAKKILRLCIT